MANKVPFDAITIGATNIDTDEFVNGAGRLTLNGNDSAVTTADGRINNVRVTITPQAEVQVYGDKTALNSAKGIGSAITCKRGGIAAGDTVWKQFIGIVTATYDDNAHTTTISIAGDPETSAS